MLHPALRARVEVFTARNAALTRHRLQRITHIVVGDHPPERINAVGKNVTMTMTMPDGSERVIRGSIMSDEQMKAQYAKLPERQTFGPSDKLRWPCRGDERKHVSDKSCPDDCCMPGLNGKCVACGDEQ